MNIVQLMIEKGALRSAQQSIDWNMAMNHAAQGGHMNIVQLMIEKGVHNEVLIGMGQWYMQQKVVI